MMRSELGAAEGEGVFKGSREPSEAVFGRATTTTAAAVLYARQAAGVLGEKGGMSMQTSRC